MKQNDKEKRLARSLAHSLILRSLPAAPLCGAHRRCRVFPWKNGSNWKSFCYK